MKTIFFSLSLILLALPADAQTLRIMPLGNSITQAESARLSYRYNLWFKLKAANMSVDFVGSQSSNFQGSPSYPDPSFDRDHEGHWGWRADELLAGLPQWLIGYTPDVVLMHAGSNDVFQGNSTVSTVQELRTIIDVIRNDNPNVTILLAKLIGTTNSTNTGIIALNSQIDGMASEKNTSASKVIVVDQYTGFNPVTDTYDGVHPNALGEEKMAQKWFDAIRQLSNSGGDTGLRAEYFNNISLSGPSVLTRVDNQVNFDWVNGPPAPGINSDNFSVRWTGEVESPITGNVTFSTVSDDGVRLWVNNVLVINNWGTHAPTTNFSVPIALTAGVKYPIRLEYFENLIGAVARLQWSYSGQALQPIPQSRLFQVTENTDVTAPTIPSGLGASNITETSFTLSWNAATDAVGVTSYEVFRNGVSIGETGSLTMMVTGGISPGSSYAMSVRAGDAAGNWSPLSSSLTVTTLSSGTNGLKGEYFNNTTLTPLSVTTRIDPQVNFDWGNGSPGAGINNDNFSVRWTGEVESPITGNVTFSTVSDDGVRLWINNVLVINNWGTHAPTTDSSSPIALTAGVRYPIRLEYFESLIGAVARLQWNYSGQTLQVIPQSRLFPASSVNPDVTAPTIPTGLSASSITETSFTLSWNAANDAVGVAAYEVFRNGTSIGTTTALSMPVNTNLSPGVTYSMTVRARDAANNWSSQSAALMVTTLPSSGNNGLQGEYFNNMTLVAPFVTTRVDPQVNFDWGNGSPGIGINNDNFSVRWTGEVESPITGPVTFSTVSDDGVRLWVNNALVINHWGVHAPTTDSSIPVSLVAGVKYSIRLEYFENAIGAVVRLLWSYQGQSQQVIPSSRLFNQPTLSMALGGESDLKIWSDEESWNGENVSVYPNPLREGNLTIKIFSDAQQESELVIFGTDSKVVLNQTILLEKGYTPISVPLHRLSAGLNIVVVHDRTKRVSRKVFVLKE